MPERPVHRNPLVTLPGEPATASGDADKRAAKLRVVAEEVAVALVAAGPMSGAAIRGQVRRRREDVDEVLRDDPRFEQVGSGRRRSLWALVAADGRENVRETSQRVATAEAGSGLPPDVTGPQNASGRVRPVRDYRVGNSSAHGVTDIDRIAALTGLANNTLPTGQHDTRRTR